MVTYKGWHYMAFITTEYLKSSSNLFSITCMFYSASRPST